MRFRTDRSVQILFVLGCGFGLCAQEPVPPPSETQLKVIVLEGDGAINNIRLGTAKSPVVRVEDERGRPIGGATVTFVLPGFGAGGEFEGTGKTFTTATDLAGRAAAHGLHPNNIAGPFQVRVTASKDGVRGAALVNQTNAAPVSAHGGSRKKLVILGLAAGAAVGAGLAIMGHGSSGSAGGSPASAGTVVLPGSPVFGPPR